MIFIFVFRFLRLLSEYDWSFFVLVVDINGDLIFDDEKEINVLVGDYLSLKFIVLKFFLYLFGCVIIYWL